MVLQTNKLDNYNRKYGEKEQTNQKQKKLSSDSSSNGEQVAQTKPARIRKTFETNKRKTSNRNSRFYDKPNWTMDHLCPAHRHNAEIARKRGT